MTKPSTLSKRGSQYAQGPNLREKYKDILSDLYDPDTNPEGFVNIGVAENFAMLPDIAKFINTNLTGDFPTKVFTYDEGPWGTERLRKAMAKFMNRTFDVLHPIDPDRLVFANGVTSLLNLLGFTIADPGDAVLLPRPIYQAFQMDFGLEAQMRPVFVGFDGVDQFSPEAASKFEEALLKVEKEGTKVKALVLCNPHNPLGQCYPKDTIIALMKLCSKFRIHLVCDEIYANSIFDISRSDAVKFTSVLSFDHTPYIRPEYVHVVYSLSKDFSLGGCRLGCIYLRNRELEHALTSITQFHWAGGPGAYIATRVLESEEWLDEFQQTARNRLAERHKLTRNLLDQADIKYHSGANAGFFLWIDLRPFLPQDASLRSEWEGEQGLVKRMLEHKVYLTEGQALSAEEPGFFRVIFAQDERTLRTGLKRLFQAIGKQEAAACC